MAGTHASKKKNLKTATKINIDTFEKLQGLEEVQRSESGAWVNLGRPIDPVTYGEAFKNEWKKYGEVATRKSEFLQNAIAEDVAVVNVSQLALMSGTRSKLFPLDFMYDGKIRTSRITELIVHESIAYRIPRTCA